MEISADLLRLTGVSSQINSKNPKTASISRSSRGFHLLGASSARITSYDPHETRTGNALARSGPARPATVEGVEIEPAGSAGFVGRDLRKASSRSEVRGRRRSGGGDGVQGIDESALSGFSWHEQDHAKRGPDRPLRPGCAYSSPGARRGVRRPYEPVRTETGSRSDEATKRRKGCGRYAPAPGLGPGVSATAAEEGKAGPMVGRPGTTGSGRVETLVDGGLRSPVAGPRVRLRHSLAPVPRGSIPPDCQPFSDSPGASGAAAIGAPEGVRALRALERRFPVFRPPATHGRALARRPRTHGRSAASARRPRARRATTFWTGSGVSRHTLCNTGRVRDGSVPTTQLSAQ